MTAKKEKWKRVIILTVLTLSIAFGLSCAYVVYKYHHTHYFSTARWLSAENNERADMINNLLSRYEFRSMTKKEIHAILGQPDDINIFTAVSEDGEETEIYYVGFLGFSDIDPSVLIITYKDNAAIEWELYET